MDELTNASLGPAFSAVGGFVSTASALSFKVAASAQPAIEAALLTAAIVLVFQLLKRLRPARGIQAVLQCALLALGTSALTYLHSIGMEGIRTAVRGK